MRHLTHIASSFAVLIALWCAAPAVVAQDVPPALIDAGPTDMDVAPALPDTDANPVLGADAEGAVHAGDDGHEAGDGGPTPWVPTETHAELAGANDPPTACQLPSIWSAPPPLPAHASPQPPAQPPTPVWVLPELAPAIDGGLFGAVSPPEPPPTPPAKPAPSAEAPDLSTGEAIKAILGLLALLALAYIAGHPAVQRFEQRLRISQIVTAGFPFVIFGAIAASESVGILSAPVMKAIAPLLPLGLGWIGFAIGIRFSLNRPPDAIDRAPVVEAFMLTTFLPFGLIVGAASVMLAIADGGFDSNGSFLRDAMVLATAGAMTAKSLPVIITRLGAETIAVQRMRHIIQLEEITAFAGLILIAAFFRPDESVVGWHLPSVGWIFVTIGIGTALGAVTFAALGTIRGATETTVVMLGSIAFAAGISSFLRLSPIVVCFLAGVLLSNLPGEWKAQVRGAVARLERPIYLIFLMIAGALWSIDDWRGWVLMLLFVAARTGGRFLSVRILGSRHPEAFTPLEKRNLAASPMGALSIAIVMTAQDLYSGTSVAWIVTAILGGAIVTEFITQVSAFATRKLFPDYSDESDDAAPPDAPASLPTSPHTSSPTESDAADTLNTTDVADDADTLNTVVLVQPDASDTFDHPAPETAAPAEPAGTSPLEADQAAVTPPDTHPASNAPTPPPLPTPKPDVEV